MFPIILPIGPFALKTISLFLVAAFLWTGFVLWKRAKEEHYHPVEIYDGFLLSTVVGVVSARAGFVIFNFDQFGWKPLSWMDIFTVPGWSWFVGVAMATLYLYKFAQKQKWDAFEILDFWAPAVMLGLSIVYLGRFFDGSAVGGPTSLPVGMVFPGLIEPHHPAQLYYMVGYYLIYRYLIWVEYHYRTYEWYRYGKKTAQTGFLVAVGTILAGVLNTALVLAVGPLHWWGQVPVELAVSGTLLIVGLIILYVRSGRPLFKLRSTAPKPKVEAFKA